MATPYMEAMQGIISNNQNERKLQAFLQQITQANQDRQEQRQAQAKSVDTLLSSGMIPPPPNPNTPDSSPPPGQASQPMQPPQAQMAAPPMPHASPMPGMAGGPVPPPTMGAQMAPPGAMPMAPPMPNQMAQPPAPPQAMPPQGWKPSPAAPPALGGASGAPPPGGPPATSPSIAPPPSPQAQPGVQQPQALDPKTFLANAVKQGATPLQAYQQLEQMMPVIQSQQREQIAQLGQQIKIADQVTRYQNTLLKQAADEKRGQQADARLAQGDARLAQQDRRIEDAEKKASRAASGPGGGAAGPMGDAREANAAQVATGQPMSQVIPGYGKLAAAARIQAHDDAIKQIMADNNMTAKEAGMELARRTTEYVAGRSSETQLTKMQGATRQAVQQLDFNVDKVSDEMKKLKSSDISPIVNAIARGEEKWTGDPAYSSLFYYMNAAATESARLLSGGQASAAQLHQGAMEEAQKWANINMTPASWGAVAKSMKDEGNYRLKTYGDAIKAGRVGGGDKTPDGPKKGDVEQGYRFKGGDPADKANWEKE